MLNNSSVLLESLTDRNSLPIGTAINQESWLMTDTHKESMLAELYELVESACKSDKNKFGYGIWSHHIVDVIRFSKELSHAYNADTEIVEIAALLHDYVGIKDSAHRENHHLVGAQVAQELLGGYGYPQKRIDIVKNCILNHRSSVNNSKETAEEVCVASADALAHINQVASLFYACYNLMDMNIDTGREWILRKLERDWEKLCPKGREIIGDKYKAAKLLFGQL